MLARYREVLREPHVARLLFTALVGRLPQGMTGLAILLLLTPTVGYGRAGLASGLSVATAGVANIVLARSVDRFGTRTTLLPAAIVYAGFAAALAAVAPRGYGPARRRRCCAPGSGRMRWWGSRCAPASRWRRSRPSPS